MKAAAHGAGEIIIQSLMIIAFVIAAMTAIIRITSRKFRMVVRSAA